MTTIKLKNGSGAPTAGDLVHGEPALDLTNKRLYTEDSGGTVIEVGTNPGVDVTFADNRKAVFGAGSDLNIYHDGSNSYINDTGTGNLFVRASDNFYVQNSAGTETKAAFTTDGAVKLYYNGGTKFQTVSGGVDVTGVITTDGMTTSADINFGDNDKAVFGAGSDLQIYHDGANSYIQNATNSLIIQNDSDDKQVIIKSDNGSGGVADYFRANGTTGEALLYHYGSSKLATTSTGIDVTGNVDASLDLLVGGAVAGNAGTRTINVGTAGSVAGGVQIWAGTTQTSFLQFGDDSSISANHYRGYLSYNHSTDTLALGAAGSTKVSVTSTGIDVTGTATVDALTSSGTIKAETAFGGFLTLKRNDTTLTNNADIGSINFEQTDSDDAGVPVNILASGDGSAGGGKLRFYTGTPTSRAQRQTIYSNGDVEFYEDTGTTAKLFWDASAESLGIGTSSPTTPLHISTNVQAVAQLESSHANGSYAIWAVGGTKFGDVGSNKGISGSGNTTDFMVASRSTYPLILGTGSTERMRIDSSGNVGINTSPSTFTGFTNLTIKGGSNGANLDFFNNSGTRKGAIVLDSVNSLITESTEQLVFKTGSSLAERMRIDSSGNLLVGKTSLNDNLAGFQTSPSGETRITRSGGLTLALNRQTSDGEILGFRKDGTAVGSIGTYFGDLTIGTGNCGLIFNDGTEIIIPANITTNAVSDAAVDLGYSAGRFKDLYLSGKAQADTYQFAQNSAASGATEAIYRPTTGQMAFKTNSAERMRIDSSGNLLVGLTSSNYLAADDGIQLNANGTARFGGSGTSARNLLSFVNGTDGTPAEVGFIQTNGSATSYSTSSDQRLKDNIVDAPSASDDIDAIQVRSFDWKADGSHQKYGMVAQELQSVAPEAVSGDADSDDMMGVDYSKLVPMLVKEIQSLRARVAQLEGEN